MARSGKRGAHPRPSTGVFPASASRSMRGMAVAIDGEIYQDAYLAPRYPDSEI
jgi:hypothetical protein